MTAVNDIATTFETQRPRLHAVAYRLLGSVSEADDAVQEAWLRLDRTDPDTIDNLPGWLTTVVAHIALDLLKARNRRREDYLGTRLPEPIVAAAPSGPGDPEHQALLADSVGLALLVVLDTLPPRDRLAFVLHDMFSVPFAEIAAIIDTTPDAARQMASRARRRVRGAPGSAPEDVDLARQRELVDAFLRAAREGDFDALLTLLAPDVVYRQDTGGIRVQDPLTGADEVARQALGRGRPFLRHARPATVNGGAGVVVVFGDRVVAVAALAIAGDRIAEIDLITDPAKLPPTPPH